MRTVRKVPLVHLQMIKEKEINLPYRNLKNSARAAKWMRHFLGYPDREHLVVCGLNNQACPTVVQIANIGDEQSCNYSLSNLFKVVMLSGATGFLLFHNHPSGDPSPSDEDQRFTDQIEEAGRFLSIPLRDHIILGDNGSYYSFRENGTLYHGFHQRMGLEA